jgi:hypothetical protein
MDSSFLKEKFMVVANLANQLARLVLIYPQNVPAAKRDMNYQSQGTA